MMYFTLGGKALVWEEPTNEAVQTFWNRIVAAYRAGTDYHAVFNEVFSAANPLLAEGRVTQEALALPIFRALIDLTDRLGIAQECIAHSADEDLGDPLVETWIPLAQAAERKGVTVPGLHGAIERREVVARPRKPGGSWLEVSQRSLDAWTPNAIRQAARKHSE